jgi:hypothetical protein
MRPRSGPRSLFTVPVAQNLPQLSTIGQEAWYLAERRARQIVRLVQPTVESNTKRTQVIAYVQKLIGTSIGTEVSSLISDFALKFFNLCWFCAFDLTRELFRG